MTENAQMNTQTGNWKSYNVTVIKQPEVVTEMIEVAYTPQSFLGKVDSFLDDVLQWPFSQKKEKPSVYTKYPGKTTITHPTIICKEMDLFADKEDIVFEDVIWKGAFPIVDQGAGQFVMSIDCIQPRKRTVQEMLEQF
jgi:hypothetical protein